MRAFDKRLLFVSGKGGVGKTTVAASLGLQLAGRGQRVMLATTQQGPLERLLACRLSGAPTTVRANLDAIVIDPWDAVNEYASMVLKSRLAASALTANRYSKPFLAAVPGLFQWAVLGKAWYHASRSAEASARYDTVVFDAPATGHALEMIRVPKLLSELGYSGVLQQDAERAWADLTDSTFCGVVAVTLAESLPVSETLELILEAGELGVHCTAVVFNAVLPPRFAAASTDDIEAAKGALPTGLGTLISDRFRTEQEERRSIARLREQIAVPGYCSAWSPHLLRGVGPIGSIEPLDSGDS